MEFYIALPCITYFEAYDFCKGLILKNMTTIVAIRTLKEDKKTGVSWRQGFVCGGQRSEKAKAPIKTMKVKNMKSP